MEFPFNNQGHHSNVTHHHHRRNDDGEESATAYPPPGNTFSSFNNPNQPPPPQHQPLYGESYPPPPSQPHHPETQVFHTSHVSPVGHVSHHSNYPDPSPPPPSFHHRQPDHSVNYGYQPTPPPGVAGYSTPVPNATVHHVSHESHHHNPHPHQPNFPTSVHHVSHQVPNNTVPIFSNKPTFRVVTKASPNYSLTIRRGEVVLAPSDPRDAYQHWYKDEKYSTRVKDSEGCPAFSLVNKVTNEAIKHSIGATHPVRLIPYNPDYLDESILWTESRDLGDSYRAIRMVNNIHLNVDAFHGDKNSGGVHDGTTIVLWEWNKGDNQQWKILPY